MVAANPAHDTPSRISNIERHLEFLAAWLWHKRQPTGTGEPASIRNALRPSGAVRHRTSVLRRIRAAVGTGADSARAAWRDERDSANAEIPRW